MIINLQEGEDITREEDDDDEEEEDEDEDEYDDEDEFEDDRRRRKRRRQTGFILEEADVDDDYDEDGEQAEDGYHDLIDTTERDDESLDADLSGARRLQQMLGDKNAEELEAYYKKKFAETSDR
ncbi:transcription elongation factor SPT5-like isoform X2 [Orbicella faveolata]|uniref:transcription elongation factor SPT5-like isoform X1 n=1 Tax=Orbicella faveolata TaxID=48498 RepID=UPI0009E305C7|nr:transcription elongation factor SPT5-like isoform X1 [Orbicella faveolata]XP_020619776.1 transcription elongation factor SPT5-like isoform X2 [Orbicella faveolata]